MASPCEIRRGGSPEVGRRVREWMAGAARARRAGDDRTAEALTERAHGAALAAFCYSRPTGRRLLEEVGEIDRGRPGADAWGPARRDLPTRSDGQ